MNVKDFADDWYERGDEKSDTQKFWLTLLRDVFDIDKPEKIIDFEKNIIDAYIARTKVLIEQKSFGVDLTKKYLQSDGELLTPFEQAKRYADALPADDKPRWIVTCNFAEFRIYKPNRIEPTVIKLRDLRYQFARLKFLIDPTADDSPPEEKISKDAANIVHKICLAFDKNYLQREPDFRELLRKFCTRLIFCFYADDAQIFTKKTFGNYLKSFPPEKLHDALQNLFEVLNTPENQRKDIDDALKDFPYVDGGLFAEKLPIPPLNQNLKLTIERAHIRDMNKLDEFGNFIKFSWREISPPIFGAMFESLLNSPDQREGGIYYTSEDNIHKVIDTLFLDDLKAEFDVAKRMQKKNRPQALLAIQDKLAALKFLDPACGSGNFLTETYCSLRRLENEILEELHGLNVTLPDNPVKVSINQFYGIEINDFAAAVAQTALWIAENQMLQQIEGALGKNLQALPLKNYATIICANALRIDWNDVFTTPNSKLLTPNYIIGNPPFVGARMKSAAQSNDIGIVFDGWQNIGNLDYVACWYKKISDFIAGTNIRAALVSTNSICQGDSIGTLWKRLFASGIHIDFAHRTFKWLSDSDNMAHVHCVVVGFSRAPNDKPKKIFVDGKPTIVEHINAYLVDGEDIFVESRNEPLQDDVPTIGIGNQPIDNAKYLFKPEEMENFIKLEPASAKYFHPWYGAEEFIKGKRRYCLWLGDLSDAEIDAMPHCRERVENVRQYRLSSKRKSTIKLAQTPTRFQVENFPRGNYLAIPQTSSERRQYMPMGFMDASNFASATLLVIPDATLYHFGILMSSIHNAWIKTTCCCLETRYRYTASIVYNNFPWCSVTDRQRRLIERSAQNILDVRAEFSGWTFAKLYDEKTMPDELRHAHKSNDYAVALAYGFENILTDEAAIVAELMKLYRQLTNQ